MSSLLQIANTFLRDQEHPGWVYGYDVLAAALLHDVGKGRVRAAERIAFVLLGAVGFGARQRLANPGGEGFRTAIWRLEHHATLGAERLRDISRPRVVWLVERHTDADPPPDEELRWLLAADNAC